MYFQNNFTKSFLTKSHQNITFGTFFLASILFFLGILTFIFPALIAYFIGSIILFTGLFVLAIGWKLWKLKNEITKFDKFYDEPPRYSSPEFKQSSITYIRW